MERLNALKVGDAAELIAEQTGRTPDFEARRIRTYSQHRIIPDAIYSDGSIKVAHLDSKGVCACRILGHFADVGFDIHALGQISAILAKPSLQPSEPGKAIDASVLGRAIDGIRGGKCVDLHVARHFDQKAKRHVFTGYCVFSDDLNRAHLEHGARIAEQGFAGNGQIVDFRFSVPLNNLIAPLLKAN